MAAAMRGSGRADVLPVVWHPADKISARTDRIFSA
jgi:hypothetical protein